VSRSPAAPALALLLAIASGAVSAASAQSPAPTADLCVLSTDELSELTGLPFVRSAAGDLNCTYDGDPSAGLVTLDLRLEPSDPLVDTGGEDDLWFTRFDYETGGRDLTIAGFPAWEADEGLWVDLGESVFVVQPILFFLPDPPDAHAFLAPIAELAIPRLGPIDGS
jgi:hypothetical protein